MFKDALRNYQKMFLGDTTEFFNYLLDGFHEDLNKVQNKPIIKSNDDTNVSNTTLSHSSWINFLRRNQSILVEIFYDQFKSTVKCPNTSCNNVNISFEPFMTVSLSMTMKTKPFQVRCYYISFDMNKKPIMLNLSMYGRMNVMALCNKVAKVFNVHPMSFYVESFANIMKIKKFCKLDYVLERKTYSYYSEEVETFYLFKIELYACSIRSLIYILRKMNILK